MMKPLQSTRNFGLMLLLAIPIISLVWFGMVRLITGHWNVNVIYYISGIGIPLAISIILFPPWGRFFQWIWLIIGHALQSFISTVLLCFVFYIVFGFTRFYLALMGKHTLAKNFNKKKETYWKEAEEIADLGRYFNQY